MKMKKIKYIGLFTLLATFSLGSCDDDFLAEKQDYNGVNEEVFTEPLVAQAYVDYVYGLFLPGDNAVTSTWDLAVAGSDDFAQTTEELAGEVNWNKPWATVNPAQAHCLPYLGSRMTSSIANNTWTRLKQINIFLNEVDKYGMDEPTKNKLKGQLYFWRAWQYFDMVKLYGGVPLVLIPQNPILDETSNNQVPRSSTSACIDQIVADLDMAKSLLPVKWTGADYGRIGGAAAAAFKGRVLLTWASPLFNPTDDTQRWQRAYDANLEAKTLLETNGYGLEANWGTMWTKDGSTNKEAVIAYAYNTVITQNLERNNGSERACRSKET
ncbi:MAG: RagB/SusD family nutrient uptake outer membrane protein, partial [Crocinitomicaceae bacterium]|nr:RagB/SusD family nutrient uptake outer membrane protein [Crocinitomicaceae bacterium]